MPGATRWLFACPGASSEEAVVDIARRDGRKVRKVSIACFLAVILVSFSFPRREGPWLEVLLSPAVTADVASVLGRYSPFSCLPDCRPGLFRG